MQYKEETLYIFFATSIFVGTYINHIVGWISSIVVAMFVGSFLAFFGVDVLFWRQLLIETIAPSKY